MVDREAVEKAIEGIDGLLLDFGNAVDELRGVRELLYSIIEGEPENGNNNGNIKK
jgi:hypothetical protein